MSKKIEKLTEFQEKQLPVYRDKWLKIGLDTTQSTPEIRKEIEEVVIKQVYKEGGLEPPEFCFFMRSPVECLFAYVMLKKLFDLDSVKTKIIPSKNFEIKANKMQTSVFGNVGLQIKTQFGDNVLGGFVNQVKAECLQTDPSKISEEINSQRFNFSYGSLDASWLSFYNFFLEQCNLEVCNRLKPLMDLAKLGHFFLPYDNVCIFSEKPLEIHMNEQRLHNEKGAAIKYADGFELYSLNGIRVPAWVVNTPADDIDPKKILKEKNVEIRRELVRKVGADKVVAKLGAKVLEKRDNYELLSVDLGLDEPGIYLRMVNPSVNLTHVEGVPPDCTTINKALAWRNGLDRFSAPLVLK